MTAGDCWQGADDIVDEDEDEELHAEQTNQQQLKQVNAAAVVADIEDVVPAKAPRVSNAPLDKSR